MAHVYNFTFGCYEDAPNEEYKKAMEEQKLKAIQQYNERIRSLPVIETMANELMLLRVEVTKLQNAQQETKALREEVARLRQALLETLDLLQSLSVAAVAAGKN